MQPFSPQRGLFPQARGNGDQYNAYFNFFADSSDDVFNNIVNNIVISQKGGGGFETDNHTFKASTKGFDESESVPEPAMALSPLVVGGAMVAKRRAASSQVG